MPTVPIGSVHQSQLALDISEARRKLGPDVLRISFTVGSDWTGEPAIFFRILLTDVAATEERLAEITGGVATILLDKIRPLENWGLIPYFNFRSETEQRASSDPEWN